MDQQAQPPAQQSSFESQCPDALQVQYPLQRPASVCIFRVPELLKDLKRAAYVPRMVSLGPCHSDMNAQFPEMNSHKAEAVRRMLNRLGRQDIDNEIRRVKAGAIDLLVELLESENANLRGFVTTAILTLSSSAINKPIMSSSWAIPLSVEMLASGNLQGQVDAVMALYILMAYAAILLNILFAGVMLG